VKLNPQLRQRRVTVTTYLLYRPATGSHDPLAPAVLGNTADPTPGLTLLKCLMTAHI
jgi:hypothetical protein